MHGTVAYCQYLHSQTRRRPGSPGISSVSTQFPNACTGVVQQRVFAPSYSGAGNPSMRSVVLWVPVALGITQRYADYLTRW